jgi:O-antigen ligase
MYFIPRLIEGEKGYFEITKGIVVFGFVSGVLLLLFFSTGYDMKHGGLNYLTVAKITGVVAIFTLTETVRVKNLLIKTALVFMFLFQLFVLLRTGSRGGMLSFLVAFFVFTVIIYRQHLLKGFIFLGVTTVVFVLILLNSPKALERVMLMFSLHKGGSIGDRITMLKLSYSLISERWLTGIGLGGFFKYHYLKYPHNLPVEVFVETGIAGFLSLIAVYAGALSSVLNNGLNAIREKTKYSPFYLSCIFVITYHMTSFGLEWTRILFFFIGTVVALSNSRSENE